MIDRIPGGRRTARTIAALAAVFLVVAILLGAQMAAGKDPALGTGQQANVAPAAQPDVAPDGSGTGSGDPGLQGGDGSVPYDADGDGRLGDPGDHQGYDADGDGRFGDPGDRGGFGPDEGYDDGGSYAPDQGVAPDQGFDQGQGQAPPMRSGTS